VGLVQKAATCRHGSQGVRLAATVGRRDPVSMADVAASGRLSGAECGVRFPSSEDGTLGIPPGSYGWRVGYMFDMRSRIPMCRRKAALRPCGP